MKEVVLITGSNGIIAKSLSEQLGDNYSLRYLTRKKRKENEFEWNINKKYIENGAFTDVSHIIHLAGAGISEKRWSENRKKTIFSSRIDSAKLILTILKKEHIKITSFISASAIGYYGTVTSEKIYYENDTKGNDFLSDVCYNWEKTADEFLNENISERVAKIRIGIVLSNRGGALEKIKVPIYYYLGAPLGNGKQYMPWIHIDDLCSIFKISIKEKKMNGVFNAVSPEYITNKTFTEILAKSMDRSIVLPNIPSIIIKLLFGEVSSLLLKGSRVSSKKIQENGLVFKYPNLEIALKNL
ncbi:MAG: TIGR01777 family protein [Bacteroidetes bacterium]|nr:TIGR01777 family protein [Bacteroidota bacterium]